MELLILIIFFVMIGIAIFYFTYDKWDLLFKIIVIILSLFIITICSMKLIKTQELQIISIISDTLTIEDNTTLIKFNKPVIITTKYTRSKYEVFPTKHNIQYEINVNGDVK